MERLEIEEKLLEYLKSHHLCIIRLPDDRWKNILHSSSNGVAYSWAAEHRAFTLFKKRALCLTFGKTDGELRAYIGIINSNGSIATTQTRIKVIHSFEVTPSNPKALMEKVGSDKLVKAFEKGVRDWGVSFHLTNALAQEIIGVLCSYDENLPVLERLVKRLLHLDVFKNGYSLQVDAVDMALSVFNYDKNHPAQSIEVDERFTSDHPLYLYEDNVVNHDHHEFMDFDLAYSDATGKAVFEKGNQKLEVFLGNKLPLESLFGVDLIYHNVTNQNTVMVQYKMMEKQKQDTIYRPDDQLSDEIKRMETFAAQLPATKGEYRLNPEHFYLKFVPRDGKLTEQTFLMPLGHFQEWIKSPAAKSTRNSVRIGFSALNGSYMRPAAFNDLLRSGYIGSYQETTKHLQVLVQETIKRGNAFVVAVQSRLPKK